MLGSILLSLAGRATALIDGNVMLVLDLQNRTYKNYQMNLKIFGLASVYFQRNKEYRFFENTEIETYGSLAREYSMTDQLDVYGGKFYVSNSYFGGNSAAQRQVLSFFFGYAEGKGKGELNITQLQSVNGTIGQTNFAVDSEYKVHRVLAGFGAEERNYIVELHFRYDWGELLVPEEHWVKKDERIKIENLAGELSIGIILHY